MPVAQPPTAGHATFKSECAGRVRKFLANRVKMTPFVPDCFHPHGRDLAHRSITKRARVWKACGQIVPCAFDAVVGDGKSRPRPDLESVPIKTRMAARRELTITAAKPGRLRCIHMQ
jgi:hypothetical protein